MSEDLTVLDTLYWWGVPSLFRCPVDPDPATRRSRSSACRTPPATARPSATSTSGRAPCATSRRCSGASTARSASRPGRRARSTTSATSRCPRANDNEAVRRAHQRRSSRASPRRARGRSRSAATIGITGGDRPGPRRRRLAADRRPAGRAAAPRRAHRRLRVHPALVRRDEVGRALGRLPRPPGQRRPGPQRCRSASAATRARRPGCEPSYELGYEVVDDRALPRARRSTRACELIRERIGDAPVYVTFDLDCLDPSVAPAVSNLEPAYTGFTIDEANATAARRSAASNVVGGDVVCLMPTKDLPNNITAMVAAHMLFEIVALVADTSGSSRDRAGEGELSDFGQTIKVAPNRHCPDPNPPNRADRAIRAPSVCDPCVGSDPRNGVFWGQTLVWIGTIVRSPEVSRRAQKAGSQRWTSRAAFGLVDQHHRSHLRASGTRPRRGGTSPTRTAMSAKRSVLVIPTGRLSPSASPSKTSRTRSQSGPWNRRRAEAAADQAPRQAGERCRTSRRARRGTAAGAPGTARAATRRASRSRPRRTGSRGIPVRTS